MPRHRQSRARGRAQLLLEAGEQYRRLLEEQEPVAVPAGTALLAYVPVQRRQAVPPTDEEDRKAE